MDAMERAGIKFNGADRYNLTHDADVVGFIISKNIRRRHLNKQERADLIVAAIKAGEKPVQAEPVSEKGGRGKKNPIKEKALAAAKEHDISEATVKRALAKAEGKTPKPKKKPKSKPEVEHAQPFDDGGDDCTIERKQWIGGVEAVWDAAPAEVKQHLVRHICKEADPVSLALSLVEMMDAEQVERLLVGVEEHRARLGRKRPSTLPQDGRSAPEDEGDDLGDIPACLDRRSVQKERAASS
jgi:hypothetical protein